MEPTTPQSNTPTTLPSVSNQLQYPFDYQTQRALDEYFATRSASAFPVGSIFMAVVSTNPSTLLGYGTWSAWGTGRMPIGVDATEPDYDVAEDTGGERTHVLTKGELPLGDYNVTVAAGLGSGAWATTAGNTASTFSGLDTAHNNLPPFISCYFWKRLT